MCVRLRTRLLPSDYLNISLLSPTPSNLNTANSLNVVGVLDILSREELVLQAPRRTAAASPDFDSPEERPRLGW